jgi:hypothetical protein
MREPSNYSKVGRKQGYPPSQLALSVCVLDPQKAADLYQKVAEQEDACTRYTPNVIELAADQECGERGIISIVVKYYGVCWTIRLQAC